MTTHTPLFNELNQTRHVHHCSQHCCKFCVHKLLPLREEYPKKNVTYIAPFEVVVHNHPYDLWISFLGRVYDLTEIVQQHKDELCVKPLIAFAGKDVSHWFDEKTGEPRHYIHPVTGANVTYCPHGRYPHLPSLVPSTDWKPEDPPWWLNDKYFVGYLSRRVRPIRIQNMLTRLKSALNVCCEDTLYRIQERYRLFNTDADSYTWCYEDHPLDMSKTLEENGVLDERDKFTSIGLPENTYVPMLLLYYNDDLKWELPGD